MRTDFFSTMIYRSWENRIRAARCQVIARELVGISGSRCHDRIYAAMVRVTLLTSRGELLERTLTLRGPCVVVIPACQPDFDTFVMVRQFRVCTGHYELEFPSGGINLGESVLEAAARELEEETGLCVPQSAFLPLTVAPLVVCGSAFDETAQWYYVQVSEGAVNKCLELTHGVSAEDERITIERITRSALADIDSFHVKAALQLLRENLL